jgi:hypothetical protein
MSQPDKEKIIDGIVYRIKEEEKKHSKMLSIDWHRIAAHKIYATFDIQIKDDKK